MSSICIEPFWNQTRSWDTVYPDFSNCFEQLVLICGPCSLLWLMIPLQAYSFLTDSPRLGRWTKLTIIKLVLCVVLATLELLDLGYAAQILVHHGSDAIPAINVISPIVQIFTFLLAMVYLDFDRRKGRLSNPLLFVFWFLLFISGIIILRTKILRAIGFEKRNPDDLFGLFTYEVWFPIVVTQLILSCFADDYPERFENWTKNPSPESNASFLNRLTAFWMNDLLRTGWKKALRKEDIWDMMHDETAESLERNLVEKWTKQFENQDVMEDMISVRTGTAVSNNRRAVSDDQLLDRSGSTRSGNNGANQEQAKEKKPSLVKAIYLVVWPRFWTSAFLKFLYDMLTIVVIVLVGSIIAYTARWGEQAWKGYVYSAFMILVTFVQTLAFVNSNFINTRMGKNVRAALSAMIFRKVLVLSNTSRRHFGVGNVTNMLTADLQRISEFFFYQHYLWITPITTLIMMTVLWSYIGISSLAGLATIIFVMGVQILLVRRSRGHEITAMRNKDVRVRTVNEIFNEIKVLKMYAWEKEFEDRAIRMREDELSSLNKAGLYFDINMAMSFVSPSLAALITYTTYLYIDYNHVLDARTAFVTLIFLFSLRHSLYLLPMSASLTVQAKLATDRIAAFLLARELDMNSVEKISQNDTLTRTAVSVVNGNFSWQSRASSTRALALKNINMSVSQGTLLAIVGAVGSGKSSLLAAILGLMEKITGTITIKGAVAYVTQQAWIQNMTLRDNILFGKPFDEDRYLSVLEACALKRDLEILPDGDQTEIGEKGINLSGGQKLRVTLARAVYADADVIILDDPLAAVDAHVGRHIFKHVVGPSGMLQGKTRIFVTNAINWLPQCDSVVYLEQGRISEMGSYEELVDRDERFGDYLRNCSVDVEQEEAEQDDSSSEASGSPYPSEPAVFAKGGDQLLQITMPKSMTPMQSVREGGLGQLIRSEEAREGGISWRTYKLLAKDMSYAMVTVLLISFSAGGLFSLGSNIWIGEWTKINYTLADGSIEQTQKSFGLGIFALLIILQVIFVAIALWGVSYGFIKAGRTLHNSMLRRLMHSPMSYFDTTPLGRILNRFSKETDTVDTALPRNTRYFANAFFLGLTFVLQIMIALPLIAAIIIPLVMAIYFVKRYYQMTAMQLKRLDGLTRAPLISSLQQSFAGTSIILATGQSARFIADSHRKVDSLSSIIHLSNAALHWLCFSNLIIANVLTATVAFTSVILRNTAAFPNEPAVVGLALVSAVAFTILLQWMIQNFCELEYSLLSTERIRDYTDAPLEAPSVIIDNRPPSKWPYKGQISFNNYSTRYRPGLQLVLEGINGTISPGEKIGVVGRTGSGKSSLTLALLRIIEPAGGSITIDGTDIAKIGLEDLRSRITIIPQEATLFSGSLRMNVDPTEEAGDEQIWNALESSRLKPYFQASPAGLDTRISEGGANLSVGQRQLICLARALLRRSKILILDEATAAIDFETDKYVQEVVRREFADCTVITIAHRINTIMDSTRVLVMDAGRIREFDSPANLIEQPDSLFYKLARDAGAL